MGPKPKRKTPGDDDDGNATRDKAQRKRLANRTDGFETAGRERDDANNEQRNTDHQRWVDKLAFHLACEPKFQKFMQNPQPLDNVLVNKEWLAAVYLPGRYKNYTGFNSWNSNWWQINSGARRMQVLNRASDMYNSVVDTQQHGIEGTLSPLPQDDPDTTKRREALFKVQSTRQKLLSLVKNVTDTQHGVAKNITTQVNHDAEIRVGDDMKSLIEELCRLERVRESAKAALDNSVLNTTGIAIIDKLLANVPADPNNGEFIRVHATGTQEVFNDGHAGSQSQEPEDSPDSEEPPDPDVVAANLQKAYKMNIDFLGGKQLNEVSKAADVMSIRQQKGDRFEKIQDTKPLQGNSFVDVKTLAKLDSQCAEWLDEISTTGNSPIDQRRFELNFRDFERVTERPQAVINQPSGYTYFRKKHERLNVARDNIWHVRRLVGELLYNDMIDNDENTLEKVQTTMRRMYALLAIMHGCCAEGAIWLTVMDHLLEELAALVIGSVNPKLESVRMHNAALILKQKSSTAKHKLNINDFKRIEREHKAREVFSEVARFYRGAVIFLFASASHRKGAAVEEETKKWYDGLLNLFAKCGHRGCAEQMKVERVQKGQHYSWSVSVAVRDARLGFPEERATVSTNRSFAYLCLWEYIGFSRYHVGLAPFFHYFAHLWHPACRPFRGKAGLLDDITMAENQSDTVEPGDVMDLDE